MDHLGLVAGLQVPEDGGVVEKCQVDHILALLELGRVHPSNLLHHVVELLMANRDDALGFEVGILGADGGDLWTRLKQPLPEPASLGARNPDRLLRVVNFFLVISPSLNVRPEEFRRVRIYLSFDQLHVARHCR